MDIQQYLNTVGEWALTSGLQILLVIVGVTIALKVTNILVSKVFEQYNKSAASSIESGKRIETLKGIITATISFVLMVVAIMMVLGELGIEIGPLIATAGVVGLAVGFGAQKLVEDVISGFFILLEDQIRVGDIVDIAGKSGLVEKINLHMVILRDLSGNVHYVRNGMIDVVTKMTKEFSRYLFDIGVAYREDVDEVIEVIKEVFEELRQDDDYKNDILEPIEIMGLDQFADSAVVIRARAKTLPSKQWGVAREFNRRLKKAFDERDIEIPFPHTTVYLGKEKDGSAAPLKVQMKSEGAVS